MNLHDFIAAVARAIGDSAKHGFDPRKVDEAFQSLPADWALRLRNQENGLIVQQQAGNVLKVSDPTGKYSVCLIVQLGQSDPAAPATS